MGRGRGQGGGRGSGRGPGRLGGAKAAGPGGQCICTRCGHKVKHQIGKPCYEYLISQLILNKLSLCFPVM